MDGAPVLYAVMEFAEEDLSQILPCGRWLQRKYPICFRPCLTRCPTFTKRNSFTRESSRRMCWRSEIS